MIIGDEIKAVAFVLKRDVLLDGAKIIAQMELARRLHAAQNTSFHGSPIPSGGLRPSARRIRNPKCFDSLYNDPVCLTTEAAHARSNNRDNTRRFAVRSGSAGGGTLVPRRQAHGTLSRACRRVR